MKFPSSVKPGYHMYMQGSRLMVVSHKAKEEAVCTPAQLYSRLTTYMYVLKCFTVTFQKSYLTSHKCQHFNILDDKHS